MKSETFGRRASRFFLSLKPGLQLPPRIELLNPLSLPDTRKVFETYHRKFYDDPHPRTLIFGINPGRFGAGVTGIAFTDPIRLEEKCGIENSFAKKPELSSVFVYRVIEEANGLREFSSRFYLSALCPYGFTRDGKNLNYYDDKNLAASVQDLIIRSVRAHLAFGAASNACICLGEGQNYSYFTKLNFAHGFFREIVPLPHPRWVMQYRRKKANLYIQKYLDALSTVHKKNLV